MSERTSGQLIKYAYVLASGDALHVRRLGEYVDWDENKLIKAINKHRDKFFDDRRPGDWDDHVSKGVHMALVKARADAADRAYRQRRHH